MRNTTNTNSRLSSLLHECGLENRLYADDRKIDMFDDIDYTEVRKRMKPNIQRSFDYLKKICE